jgi:DNA-binding HxlR family transcriptional regulator
MVSDGRSPVAPPEGVVMAGETRSGCPINAAAEAFGDRWILLILLDVMFGGRRHFRELQGGSEERITSNILADRLKRLMTEGLLTRDGARPGQKATYSLTDQAIQLVLVVAQLGAWGARHRPTVPVLRERAEQPEGGGSALWDDYMDELREMHLAIPRQDQGRQLTTRLKTEAICEAADAHRASLT